jgi:hypothetical protein
MRRLRIHTGTYTTSITYTNTILNGTDRCLTRISTYTSHCYTATRTIRIFTTGIVTKLRWSFEKGCIQWPPLSILPASSLSPDLSKKLQIINHYQLKVGSG